MNEWENVKARLAQLGESRQTAEVERLTAQRVVDEAADDGRFFATVVTRTSTLEVVALPALAAAVAALGVVLGASLLRERGRARTASAVAASAAERRAAAMHASADGRKPRPKPARTGVGSSR